MVQARSIEKRKFILKKAKTIFEEKGFARVTMKDIVDACEISRGGLYLYFNSTKALFLEIFRDEASKQQMALQDGLDENESPYIFLKNYFCQFKEEMMSLKPSLSAAIYEFFKENKDEQIVRCWQFDNLAELYREILDAGIQMGEFKKIDTGSWGRHFAYFTNSFTLSMAMLCLPEQRIDEEINLLLEPILTEETKKRLGLCDMYLVK